MQIDYKITGTYRDGVNTLVTIILYTGAVTTEKERSLGVMKGVTRYRRTGILDERKYVLDGDYPDEKVRDAMNLILDEEAGRRNTTTIDAQKLDPDKVAKTPTPTLINEQ